MLLFLLPHVSHIIYGITGKEGKAVETADTMHENLYYPRKIVNSIKENADLIHVIAEYIKTDCHGETATALCPFHDHEDDAGNSLLISNKTRTWQCTECGENGDVFSFLMKYKGISMNEAIELLAAKEEITLPEPKEAKAGKKEREIILKINLEAARYYFHSLKGNDHRGIEYLHQRGLSNHTIKQFGIGFAPAGRDGLYQYLIRKGYTKEQLSESGLFSFYENRTYDKFRNRVMCPVIDTERNVLGFSGRTVAGEDPKYKNSPATFAFDKKTVLYGLNIAKDSSRSDMILCEGNMDVISLHQAGFDNAVASLGTAFSKEHSLILKGYTDHIHLVFDSDDPGIKAALRAIPILQAAGIHSDVVHLDPYKDPDEFIRAEGAHGFQNRLDNAENSIMFKIRNEFTEYDMHASEDRIKATQEFSYQLIGQPDSIKKEYVSVWQEFLKHYDEIQKGEYIKTHWKDPNFTAVSYTDQPKEPPEEISESSECAFVDTSWLEDYSL